MLFLPILSFFLCLIALKIPFLCPNDIPKERSSHVLPTPRSGPILALGLLLYLLPIAPETRFIIFGIYIVGYLDDHLGLSPIYKFLFQLIFVGFLIHKIQVPYIYIIPLVALSNFTNFMDGINGLMLFQLAIISFGLAFLSPFYEYYLLCFLIIIGIIPLNFPKAYFFSGDSTSLTMPIILSFPLLHNPLDFAWSFLSLTSVLWVDPILTLLRRLYKGEPFYQAHKTHAYQIANQKGLNQISLTLGLSILTICVSLLLILLPFKMHFIIFILSWTTLGFFWFYFNRPVIRSN